MKKTKSREYTEAVLSAVLIALLIRFFVFEAFKIPSASMVPTLQIGDHIFVNKFLYGVRDPFTQNYIFKFADPKRGDVVVFIYPPDEDKNFFDRKDFIKRVVGLPGDHVRTEGEDLYINGKKMEHTPAGTAKNDVTYMDELLDDVHHLIQYSPYRTYADREYTVPENNLMVMGDNRDNSADSREWGFMPTRDLKGKAMFVWLSCGEPDGPPESAIGKGLEVVRSTVARIPIISAIFPCDGHWGSIRWDRFGHWIH